MVRFDRSVAGDWFDAAIRSSHGGSVDDYMIGKDVAVYRARDLRAHRISRVAHRLEFNARASDEDDFVELMKLNPKAGPRNHRARGLFADA